MMYKIGRYVFPLMGIGMLYSIFFVADDMFMRAICTVTLMFPIFITITSWKNRNGEY